MIRPRLPSGRWRYAALVVALAVVAVAVATNHSTVSATTTSTLAATTTTIAPEPRQAGWTAVSASNRGVMVDFRDVRAGGAVFRVIRMRARTTLLRWHVGSGDPNLWAQAPADAGPRIDWANEGPAGVVAVFNGAFKQSALAGGAVVDGVVLIHLVPGYMTIALDRAGHWEMGVWGASTFPARGFHPISYRQNLVPMVLHGAPTPSARSSNWHIWGSPLNNNPLTARSGLGVDARGNLVYVATMQPVMPVALAQALVAAGVVTGMELDINPFWPIAGAASRPWHGPAGVFNVQIPNSQHNASIYATGWQRDFFVALGEPNAWSCNWQSPGVVAAVKRLQPQPLALSPPSCHARAKIPSPTRATTTTATPASTTTGAATP